MENETFEEFSNDMLGAIRRQARETAEQKADQWGRIARHLGQSEGEVRRLRALVLGNLN